jgi:hypothetical protein
VTPVSLWEPSGTSAPAVAIWSSRLVRTCVSKSDTVAASCVPVWLARATGFVASFDSAIAAPPATFASVTVASVGVRVSDRRESSPRAAVVELVP